MLVHLGYLVYLALGGFPAWRRRALVWPHLVAVAWGVAVITFSISCPLTTWENQLRDRAADATYEGSFIDHYIAGVIYPEDPVAARWLLAAGIALSWAGTLWLWLRQRRRNRAMPEQSSETAVGASDPGTEPHAL